MRKILILIAIFITAPAQAGWFGDYFDVGRNSCYQRIYSSKHLAQHPKQTIRRIFIGHFPQKFVGKEGYEGAVMKDNNVPEILMEVKAWFRDAKGPFFEDGVCSKKDGIVICGIECDGGGFEIQRRKDGKLLLKTGSPTIGYTGFRVVKNGSCDGSDGKDVYRYISRDTDDKSFILTRLPASQYQTPPVE